MTDPVDRSSGVVDRLDPLRDPTGTLVAPVVDPVVMPVEPGPETVRVLDPEEIERYLDAASGAAGLRKEHREKVQLEKLARQLADRGPYRLAALAPDWSERIDALETDMPAFSGPIALVRSRCELGRLLGKPVRIPPMLLAGLPGVGKTYFASRLARALGVPSYLHPLQTAESVSTLTGSDKHWGNSEPGYLFQAVVLGAAANPLVILDELDKVRTPSDRGGYAPARELLALTEMSTSARLRDKCVDLVFDASHVIYVARANRLSTIEAPLLSRFRVFAITEPDARTRIATARSVARDAIEALGLEERFAPPSGETLQQLALVGNARLMRQLVEDGLASALADGRAALRPDDLVPAHLRPTIPGRVLPC